MTVADGLRVQLVASEPMMTQPVCIEFDDRGRLWVIQYLQYPNPAGLNRAKVDRYSRTTYDRVPEPPPRGPRGADRITILEDTDGDGCADQAKDFVNGLNLCSGLAFGYSGVFVLQAPYLLFYPDRDGDDLPDSAPAVLVSGFGMDDAHSVANSLTWGPDGWLYGCQGSTVTAHIRGLEFQQGVWRYHPVTDRFELFCEGGGNAWGLDFDADGELLYSTNVGGYRMLHGVQGAYYWKSFGKHGALHNPHAYGWLEHVPHRDFSGGHVTVGGIIYQAGLLPERFRGKYISGDLLGHTLQWHTLEPSGSTFTSSHGGDMLVANDTWFAPSDVTVGPDGAIYVADWYDKRTAHPDPDAEWDRSNGRIYRIAPVAADMRRRIPGEAARLLAWAATVVPDFAKLSSAELVNLVTNRNDWIVRRARRVLAERRDPQVTAQLRQLIFQSTDEHHQLEALWALYASGGFDERLAEKLLSHHNANIRTWTIRFLGDDWGAQPPRLDWPTPARASHSAARSAEAPNAPRQAHVLPDTLARHLVQLAVTDPSPKVRSQLACTAKRLCAAHGLPVANALALRDDDARDPHIPLLLWWAVEQHATNAINETLELFVSPKSWKALISRDTILPRLMRRYAAAGTEPALIACARLLAAAPTPDAQDRLLASLDLGLRERFDTNTGPGFDALFSEHAFTPAKLPTAPHQFPGVPAALESELMRLWRDDTTDALLIRVASRLGKLAAQERLLALALDAKARESDRLALIPLLAETMARGNISPLLKLLAESEPVAIRAAALDALQGFDNPRIAGELLLRYPGLNTQLRSRARDALLSRKPWALVLLRAVEFGNVPAAEISVAQLRQVSVHNDPQLDALVRKHWGSISRGTPEEKLAEMRRLANDLRAGSGDVTSGHELFRNLCASCHRLFDEGENVGPDLTHANRADREFLLASLVDPSAVVRKEFMNFTVETKDGRVLSGLVAEQSPASVTLLAARNERTTLARSQVRWMEESTVSLMAEDLLKPLRSQEVRDLFAYLQSPGGEVRVK